MREIYTKLQSGAIHSKDCLEDNELARIEVDVEASEFKENNPWLLSVFLKYDGFDELKDGYEEYLETKESLIIALEYEDKAHYLGCRVVDGWSEFYFCAKDSKKLDGIVSKILNSSAYVYESNVVRDTKWGFYETQLFPSELELAHIQSAKIIFLLEEEGENLSVERDVEHYASFDTPTQKNKFINTLLDANLGYSFKDDISSEEFPHGVAMLKKHDVTEDTVKKVVVEIFGEIKKLNGYYEGWSTTLVAEIDNKEE